MQERKLGYENEERTSPGGILIQTIFVLFGIVILASWAATQYAAAKLAYQPALGQPLYAFANGIKVYTPFDFFIWLIKFGHVNGTEKAFNGGELILASLHFLFVPAIWMAVRRAKKFGTKSTLHGSAEWASKEDIYNAALLRRPISAIKKAIHKIVDVDSPIFRWLIPIIGYKPLTGATGVYVGAWVDPDSGEYHYLTHDGPEHVLAFAPTRCLEANTEILANIDDKDKVVRIAELSVIDAQRVKLWTGDYYAQMLWCEKTSVPETSYNVTFGNGVNVSCTGNHVWPTVFNGQIRTDELKTGTNVEVVALPNGHLPRFDDGCVIDIKPSNDTEYYDLEIDDPAHLYALPSGLLTHNSGKGVGLVLPTLLSWRHSALVHDIKGEAWALTSGFRKAIGQKVIKFQPTAMDGSSVRFNPLEEIRIGTMREVADAQNVAQMIVDPDGKGMEDHWAKTGHELLSAALLHILYAGRDGAKTLRGLVSFFCDPTMTIEQVAEAMLNTEHDPDGKYNWEDPITGQFTKVHPVVAESARSFLNKSENERSGVQSTAMSFLSLYRDPVVAMNTAVSEFRVDDLMDFETPVTLYLVVPPNDMARLRPLIRLVINQIIRQRTEMMEFADGRSVAGYKHRLLAMLDEFPALGKLELMEEALAFIAGYGIKCFLITQDLTQLYKAYTKDESIISNAHIRIAYAPNKLETAELLSKYTGQATVNNAQKSYSGNRLNPLLMHVMEAEQLQGRALLTPDECLRIPAPIKSLDGKNIIAPGDMLILPAGSNPIYGKQILYFKDPVFDARSKIKPPKQSDRLYKRGSGKPAPIPCDPALAKVHVENKKSELDNFVKVDDQSDQFIKPTGEVVNPVAEQQTSPVIKTEMHTVPPVGSAARVFHDQGIPSPGFTVAAAAATGAAAYTAEEIAAMDAEAEAEADMSDSGIEAAMLAESDEDDGPPEPDFDSPDEPDDV